MNQEAMASTYLVGKWPMNCVVRDVVRSSAVGELIMVHLNKGERDAMEKLRSIYYGEGQFRARVVMTGPDTIYDGDVIVRYVAPNSHDDYMVQLRLEPGSLFDDAPLWAYQDRDLVIAMVQVNDDESPVNQAKKEVVEKAHRGRQMKLSNVAHIMCTNPKFWQFLTAKYGKQIHDVYQAKTMVYRECRVDSCSRLDHEPDAARAFHSRLRKPYLNWMGAN